jgi:hypothetical protein
VTPLEEARWWANAVVELLEDEIRRTVLSRAADQGVYWLGGRDNTLDDRDLLTTREASELLGVPPERLRVWAFRGKLKRVGYAGREAVYQKADITRLRDELMLDADM